MEPVQPTLAVYEGFSPRRHAFAEGLGAVDVLGKRTIFGLTESYLCQTPDSSETYVPATKVTFADNLVAFRPRPRTFSPPPADVEPA